MRRTRIVIFTLIKKNSFDYNNQRNSFLGNAELIKSNILVSTQVVIKHPAAGRAFLQLMYKYKLSI